MTGNGVQPTEESDTAVKRFCIGIPEHCLLWNLSDEGTLPWEQTSVNKAGKNIEKNMEPGRQGFMDCLAGHDCSQWSVFSGALDSILRQHNIWYI